MRVVVEGGSGFDEAAELGIDVAGDGVLLGVGEDDAEESGEEEDGGAKPCVPTHGLRE